MSSTLIRHFPPKKIRRSEDDLDKGSWDAENNFVVDRGRGENKKSSRKKLVKSQLTQTPRRFGTHTHTHKNRKGAGAWTRVVECGRDYGLGYDQGLRCSSEPFLLGQAANLGVRTPGAVQLPGKGLEHQLLLQPQIPIHCRHWRRSTAVSGTVSWAQEVSP
jgi:hypothetical protein